MPGPGSKYILMVLALLSINTGAIKFRAEPDYHTLLMLLVSIAVYSFWMLIPVHKDIYTIFKEYCIKCSNAGNAVAGLRSLFQLDS